MIIIMSRIERREFIFLKEKFFSGRVRGVSVQTTEISQKKSVQSVTYLTKTTFFRYE